MDITFKTKKLEKYANKDRSGDLTFKKFNIRVKQLRISKTLEDVRNLSGRFHELKADRKGQWACDLDHPRRLIFRPRENPTPMSEDGIYIWSEIKGVEILEITDYH